LFTFLTFVHILLKRIKKSQEKIREPKVSQDCC
jgi:hypothetical protein